MNDAIYIHRDGVLHNLEIDLSLVLNRVTRVELSTNSIMVYVYIIHASEIEDLDAVKIAGDSLVYSGRLIVENKYLKPEAATEREKPVLEIGSFYSTKTQWFAAENSAEDVMNVLSRNAATSIAYDCSRKLGAVHSYSPECDLTREITKAGEKSSTILAVYDGKSMRYESGLLTCSEPAKVNECFPDATLKYTEESCQVFAKSAVQINYALVNQALTSNTPAAKELRELFAFTSEFETKKMPRLRYIQRTTQVGETLTYISIKKLHALASVVPEVLQVDSRFTYSIEFDIYYSNDQARVSELARLKSGLNLLFSAVNQLSPRAEIFAHFDKFYTVDLISVEKQTNYLYQTPAAELAPTEHRNPQGNRRPIMVNSCYFLDVRNHTEDRVWTYLDGKFFQVTDDSSLGKYIFFSANPQQSTLGCRYLLGGISPYASTTEVVKVLPRFDASLDQLSCLLHQCSSRPILYTNDQLLTVFNCDSQDLTKKLFVDRAALEELIQARIYVVHCHEKRAKLRLPAISYLAPDLIGTRGILVLYADGEAKLAWNLNRAEQELVETLVEAPVASSKKLPAKATDLSATQLAAYFATLLASQVSSLTYVHRELPTEHNCLVSDPAKLRRQMPSQLPLLVDFFNSMFDTPPFTLVGSTLTLPRQLRALVLDSSLKKAKVVPGVIREASYSHGVEAVLAEIARVKADYYSVRYTEHKTRSANTSRGSSSVGYSSYSDISENSSIK